jgi:Esterase PHB depolymerase
MTSPELIDVAYLQTILFNTALTGFADPLSYLSASRVWLFSAINDTVVATDVVRKAGQVYEPYLSNPSAQIAYVLAQVPGEHAQLTTNYGNACNFLGTPYINICGYDAAYNGLSWVMNKNLSTPAEAMTTTSSQLLEEYDASVAAASNDGPAPTPGSQEKIGNGTLYVFDVTAFVAYGGGVWSEAFGLQSIGYLYAPFSCNNTACPLVVAFHGCEQSLDDVGETFIRYSGYIPLAEANNFIVLFPQARANVLNPKACWDWWGYTGTAYASNIGAQTLTVKRIVDALQNNPITPNSTSTLRWTA